MTTQLKILGVVMALAGVFLIGLALWWVYRPLCPAFAGMACLLFARMAFQEAKCSRR